MGQQHRHWLEPVLQDQLGDTVRRIHSWIDDHAFLARLGGRQIAVGLPRPSRK
jgi:GGDEF domain-containing protein